MKKRITMSREDILRYVAGAISTGGRVGLYTRMHVNAVTGELLIKPVLRLKPGSHRYAYPMLTASVGADCGSVRVECLEVYTDFNQSPKNFRTVEEQTACASMSLSEVEDECLGTLDSIARAVAAAAGYIAEWSSCTDMRIGGSHRALSLIKPARIPAYPMKEVTSITVVGESMLAGIQGSGHLVPLKSTAVAGYLVNILYSTSVIPRSVPSKWSRLQSFLKDEAVQK